MATKAHELAYFQLAQSGAREVFEPLPSALANWGKDRLQGPAVTGLLARGAMRRAQLERPEFSPARASIELFQVAYAVPTTVHTEVVRNGSRILVIDAFFMQEGNTVARAHTYFFRPGVSNDEGIWSPERRLIPPSVGTLADKHGRSFRSEGTDWSSNPLYVTRPTQKFVWQSDVHTIKGELPSGFERISSAADLGSMTVHWDPEGVQYINTDVSLSLSRMPIGTGIGVAALDWSSHAGISAGAATLFDECGALGVVLLSGIAQTRVRVDFTADGFSTRKIPVASDTLHS